LNTVLLLSVVFMSARRKNSEDAPTAMVGTLP